MGREAYRLASVAMDSSAGQDMLWRDAGLIALGYFRILEVELNERLLSDSKAFFQGFFAFVSDPSGRLMLGPLRKMCDDFARPPPHIDTNLRGFVQSAFEAQLTPAGRAAFYSQKLIETISSSRVSSYRNPPAHGQFIGISEAKNCQELVNESLKDYFLWFVAYAT